ncbi:MAG: WD40/YVTN/BNR-like repeat-containing protein [Gemmatimonadota bacterium]
MSIPRRPRNAPTLLRSTLRAAVPAALSFAVFAAGFALSPAIAGAQAPSPTPEAMNALALREIGPATMSGRIVDLAVVEKDTRVFYVAAATGGVWKTTDNGIRWTPVFYREAVHSVGDIAVHQQDTSIVWVGTGERANRQSSSWGDGVYKSTDGGESWANMGLRDSKHIGRIALHPTDPRTVYVAAMGHLWGPNEERGLYKSSDGGETWERILYVDENTGAVDVALDPRNPQIVYAAMYQRRRRPWGFHGGGPGSGLYRSSDGGATWTRLTNAGLENGLPTGILGRIGISIYRKDPRIVYVSMEQGERYSASTTYEKRGAGLYRSEDRGETWTLMSDWNPRPMYASQPLVDPNDDQRIYMLNAYSYSDDGGKTFTVPRGHRTHGDDRLVWVDPNDSRHVLKADDGGLGISYDRGDHFLYVTNLPLSQWYRVSVDMAHPYNVYGGLQDNGSWRGPNQVYRSEGILNEDWVRWGGGDGFLTLVDTTDNRISYVESQYLGLTRNDLVTGETRNIRPNQPEGFIAARRNWTTWPDLSDTPQRLGNAMPPGNWEGPFIISPHDANTLYAGLNELFKTTDRGDSWRSLGDLTTGTDRRKLKIMGELPDSFTLSLDDGIPYWPTLSAVAESEFTPGILYVGTDDGLVQVSLDDGRTWTDVTDRIPGAPTMMWVNRIHPSKHVPGRVYLAANNYRNDDYGNYAWRSDDNGMSWTSIVGDLPPERVVRVVKDDPRNPDLLWMGTEFGAFWSWNGGRNWIRLDGGLPTVAVNDLVVHPRENDLVLGTHGRGVWILDQINAFQEMNEEVAAATLHLFSMEPAEQIRYRRERAHTGNMIFEGANPPRGAVVDYWLGRGDMDVTAYVLDEEGRTVATLRPRGTQGMNRILWNLRYGTGEGADGESRAAGRRFRGPSGGALVPPGLYTVVVAADGQEARQVVQVRDDPRMDTDPWVRRGWSRTVQQLTDLLSAAQKAAREVSRTHTLARDSEQDLPPELLDKVADLDREFSELVSRTARLRFGAEGWVGPLSADQESQHAFLAEMLATLSGEWAKVKPLIGSDR